MSVGGWQRRKRSDDEASRRQAEAETVRRANRATR